MRSYITIKKKYWIDLLISTLGIDHRLDQEDVSRELEVNI